MLVQVASSSARIDRFRTFVGCRLDTAIWEAPRRAIVLEMLQHVQAHAGVRLEPGDLLKGGAVRIAREGTQIGWLRTVAVVGHTGSGKSTLVGLIPRLMDPTEGH